MTSPVDFSGLAQYTEKELDVIHDRLSRGWSWDECWRGRFTFSMEITQGKTWTVRFDRTLQAYVSADGQRLHSEGLESYRARRMEMTAGIEFSRLRSRAEAQSHSSVPVDNVPDWEASLIREHLGEGWVKEKDDEENIVFGIRLEDGRKWTRSYDKKTCRFLDQRFYSYAMVAKAVLELPKEKG